MKPISTVLFIVVAMMICRNGSSPSAFGQKTDSKLQVQSQELFKKLDENKDGTLTADEIGKERRKFFERLVRTGDQNKDGHLNREEFSNALKRQNSPTTRAVDSKTQNQNRPGGNRDFNPKQFFERFDTNKDGKLSLKEFPEPMRPRMKSMFEKAKKDAISLEEFARFRRGAPREGGRPQARGSFFKQLDKNNDGEVSLEEIPAGMQRRLKPVFERSGKKFLTREDFYKAMANRATSADGKDRPDANRRPDGNRKRESDRNSDRRPSARNSDRNPGNSKGERRPGTRDGDRRPDASSGDRRPEGPQDEKRGGRERGDRPNDRSREGNRSRGERGPGRSGGPAFFRLLDENRDGQLSKNELAKAAEKLMELDRNKDGSLDAREMFGSGPSGFRGPFGSRSGSRSGSRFDFRPPFERRGDDPRPDASRPSSRPSSRPDEASGERRRPDGSLQRSRGDSSRSRSRGRKGEAGRGPGSPRFVEELLKRLDKNSDGKISKSESSERLLEGFSRFDGNKNGSLDLEELKKVFSPRGERAPQRKRPEGNRREQNDKKSA